MLDFLQITTETVKKGLINIYPKFIIRKSDDLMIRGGDLYAVWNEPLGKWSTEEDEVTTMIDNELRKYYNEHKDRFSPQDIVTVKYMWDSDSGIIDKWHKYCQKQMRDRYVMLDENIVFSNDEVDKRLYSSKRLSYPLVECDIPNWNKLIGTLYDKEEREKIEWAIGAIVSGDSKKIHKFLVLYGSAGTGKSTILNIIQQLFDGYYSVFDAKALGSSNNAFALEAFKNNPLVAIQHDGDLSKIEDNTRLNSLVSHESMTVNEKYKSSYANSFKCFLFMGTNKHVKITDAKSGLIRRLIDVSPSGRKLPNKEYNQSVNNVKFELGGIAKHCLDFYLNNKNLYDDYIPINMLGATNDFYNFVMDSFNVFEKTGYITLRSAWEMYNKYCDDVKMPYPLTQRVFKDELKNYFKEYKERHTLSDGSRIRSVFVGFKTDKFDNEIEPIKEHEDIDWLNLKEQKSLLDNMASDYSAQYANKNGSPSTSWVNVKNKLRDIDSSKLHWLRLPINHIVVDFDMVDEKGNKSLELNIKEAKKFPVTYAEVSKGGGGLHLHYIYTGDPTELANKYADHIEIKVFSGNASIRRKLSKCNDINVTSISSGLPMKGVKKMLNEDIFVSEKTIRKLIESNLRKEIHPGTKPSMDFIKKILDDAYDKGIEYNVEDMRHNIFVFASRSTNQKDYCIKLISSMKFSSEKETDNVVKSDVINDELIFFDIEVVPNYMIIGWMRESDSDDDVKIMINPKPEDILELCNHKLVGFNCRGYDNHILYGGILGYDNKQIHRLSTKIISNVVSSKFPKAYNISYADIYDYSIKKQSLKKFEIELGLKHKEMEIDWNEDLPDEKLDELIEYLKTDVVATKHTHFSREADFNARKVLAKIANMTVNDTTNSLTTRIIFGNDKSPQSQFNYRDMSKGKGLHKPAIYCKVTNNNYEDDFTIMDENDKPVFPGYKFDGFKSTYRNEKISEGGSVYSEPGVYFNCGILDIVSMHPTSIIMENFFGDKYTKVFKSLVDARVAIKHKDYEKVKTLLNGAFKEYAESDSMLKLLSTVLKIPINSVYGLTSAKFENPFKHPDNLDNIVAKRGALFMTNLRKAVQGLGYKVIHIKTDSIKIANIDDDIIDFVNEYGRAYGYEFEYEGHYKSIALVNDAVYVAQYSDHEINKANGHEEGEWTATGTQFSVPYVYKTLFSGEEVIFDDLCETKNVTNSSIYLDFNEDLEDIQPYIKELDSRKYNLISESKKRLNKDFIGISDDELEERIKNGRKLQYVGRVGKFTPVISGVGGGELYRVKDDKFYHVSGTKNYRWLESDSIEDYTSVVDYEYFDRLKNEAIFTINEFITDTMRNPFESLLKGGEM